MEVNATSESDRQRALGPIGKWGCKVCTQMVWISAWPLRSFSFFFKSNNLQYWLGTLRSCQLP